MMSIVSRNIVSIIITNKKRIKSYGSERVEGNYFIKCSSGNYKLDLHKLQTNVNQIVDI